MRTYLVLRREANNAYRLIGSTEAGSGEQAIRQAGAAHGRVSGETDTPGTYVAVPERNWTELPGNWDTAPRFVVGTPGSTEE